MAGSCTNKKKENVRNDFLLSFYYLSGRIVSSLVFLIFVRYPPRININDNNVVSFLMCVQEHAVAESQSFGPTNGCCMLTHIRLTMKMPPARKTFSTFRRRLSSGQYTDTVSPPAARYAARPFEAA